MQNCNVKINQISKSVTLTSGHSSKIMSAGMFLSSSITNQISTASSKDFQNCKQIKKQQ